MTLPSVYLIESLFYVLHLAERFCCLHMHLELGTFVHTPEEDHTVHRPPMLYAI